MSELPGSTAPVIVLTASRSGSTLLRFILDSHPELACPPETSFTVGCAMLARTWDVLESAGSVSKLVTEPARPSPDALAAVRDAVDRAWGRYLRRRGKRRWCDKSLDSYMHADLLTQLYPEAKFVCLYRHCMDVIASGVEVCPWGVHRFGFDPFVAQNPGNSVAAIGSYWLKTAQAMLAFEGKHPESCHRIRYEDLVTAPEETAEKLFSFLGERHIPGITTACFDTPHESNGPSDEKLWFSTAVSAGSMGRGVTVPAAALPGPVREPINEALAKLGYRPIDDQWNNAPGPVDPRISAPGPPATPDADHACPRAETKAALAAVSEQIASCGQAQRSEITRRWPALAGQAIALVVQDTDGSHEELRVSFPPATPAQASPPQASTEPVATLIASPATWHGLLNGPANMVTEITSARLRCINRRDQHRIRSDEVHAIAALLGLARLPLAATPTEATPTVQDMHSGVHAAA